MQPDEPEEVPTLFIDDREDEARIKEISRRRLYRTEVKRLDVGDILIGDSCVEVKTTKDLIGSIMDGRIFNQIKEMDLSYPGSNYLFILGTLQEARYSRPQWRYDHQAWSRIEASYRGAVWSILEGRATQVLFLKDTAEMCDWLAAKAKRMTRGEKASERPIQTLKSHDRTPAQEVEDVLCALSGVGRQAARALLAEFGSVAGVVSADPKALMRVDGVGKVRAVHLNTILNQKVVVTHNSVDGKDI